MALPGSVSSAQPIIRLARSADSLAVARVHVRSWQAAYQGLLPQAYLDGLKPEDLAAHYNFAHSDMLQPRTLVAARDHEIYGFATTVSTRKHDAQDSAELAALYVDPDHWGHGFGMALLTEACKHLASNGYRQAHLWVLAGNLRARHFYMHHGWQTDGLQKTDVVWGVTVQEILFQRSLIAP